MSTEVFFVAAIEGQAPFDFFPGTIKVEGQCDIASFQNAVVEKYAQLLHTVAATVYQLHEPRLLHDNDASLELADSQTLRQKANELYPDKLIQHVLSTRQTLVVLLQCAAPSPTAGGIFGRPKAKKRKIDSAESDTALKAFYENAWGKTWPSVVHEISRTDIGQFDENEIFPYPPRENDVPEKLQYRCLNGMREVAKIFSLITDLQDVVVLQEYTLLRDWLYMNQQNIAVVGQPGTGKTTFLLYLLLHRLERKEPTVIQFTKDHYFSFDEDGARVCSDEVYFGNVDKFWALVDTNPWIDIPSSAIMSSLRIVQVSSPQGERWKPWMQQKGGLYIASELPTVLEIAAVLKLVGRWGPSIRTITRITQSEDPQTIQAYEQQLSQTLQKIFLNPTNISAESGSMVFFLRPPPDRGATTRTFSPTWEYFIPTKFLHGEAMNHFFRLSNQNVHELYFQLSFHSASRSLAGYAFEGLMHFRMSESTPLKLTDQGLTSMDMQTSSNLVHGTVDSLKEQKPSEDFYWMPATSNFHGIDSVLSDGRNLFLLQATVAGKHRDPKAGILKVWSTMSKQVANSLDWHIIAVTDKVSHADSLRKRFMKELEGFYLGQSQTVVKVWSCVLAEPR